MSSLLHLESVISRYTSGAMFYIFYFFFFVFCCFFFFNDTATTEIYTLSLHDALPILNGLVDLYTVKD